MATHNTMHQTLQRIESKDWKMLEALEKRCASPFFHSCEGEIACRRYIETSTVYLIMVDSTPIGSVSYKKKNDGSVLIDGLTVVPEHRRKGIAKAAFLSVLHETQAPAYSLMVHPQNTPALLLYLTLGFTIDAWHDNPFGNNQPRLSLSTDSVQVL